MNPLLRLRGVSKSFTLHQRGGVALPVLRDVNLDVFPGECLVLDGPSGSGKSSLLRLIYGNYRASGGSIRFDHMVARRFGATPSHYRPTGSVDLAQSSEREVTALRRDGIGYVSQFLRAIPRVGAADVVAEPLLIDCLDDEQAQRTARSIATEMLSRMRLDRALWNLPPATFSGGEQQRVNLARGLIKKRPLLLLDEPTASLDDANREIVVKLIQEFRQQGAAIIGIFHDVRVSDAVATRRIDMSLFK